MLNRNIYHACVKLMAVVVLIAMGTLTSYGFYEAKINVTTHEVEENSDIVPSSLGWTECISIDIVEGDTLVARIFDLPGLSKYIVQKTYASYEINVDFKVGTSLGDNDNQADIAENNGYDTIFTLTYDKEGLKGSLYLLWTDTEILCQRLGSDPKTISMEYVLDHPLLFYRDITDLFSLFMRQWYSHDEIFDFLQEYEKRMSSADIPATEDRAFRTKILWYKYAIMHSNQVLGLDELKELGEIMNEIYKTALNGDEK